MDMLSIYPIAILLAVGLGSIVLAGICLKQYRKLSLVQRVLDGWINNRDEYEFTTSYLAGHNVTRIGLNCSRLGCIAAAVISAATGLWAIVTALGALLSYG